jgi:hypothetical protein
MSLDSTANLLFTIGANTDDGVSNVQAFRALLGKSLSDIGGDFDDWKTKVLGDVSTVEGAMMAGGAAMLAGLVAAGAAAVHCADQYEQYVESVAKVSKITGIAVEDVSRLKFAVEATGGNFDTAGQGLAKFTSNVVKAAEGSTQQAAAFARLGITQKQLEAGEHNMLPLLEAVAEKFQGLKDKTDRTTEARDLFGRSGTQFLNFLALGRDGLKQMANEADRLGLIVGQKDVEALHAYQAAMAEMKATQEAVDIEVGRQTLPLLTTLKMAWGSLIQTMAQGGGPNGSGFITTWAANLAAMKVSADGLAESLARIGKNQLTPPADDAPKVEKTKVAWSGLSDLLEQVKLKLAATVNEEAKTAEEVEKIGIEMAKAVKTLDELRPKLKDGVFDQQYADAQELLRLIPELYKRMMDDIANKRRVAGQEAQAELVNRLNREQAQTQATKEAEWNYEIDKLRTEYAQKGQLTAANEMLIVMLRQSGINRIREAQKAADAQEAAAAAHKLAAEKVAFDSQMAALAKHLEQIQRSHQTSEERIRATYADDVSHFAAAEEKKELLAATSDAQRTAIAQKYAQIRAALLVKEGQDLQALHNSQGWRGIFGQEFAQMIRGNEALTKQWETSTNQSLMLVRVTLEGLKEEGQQAFAQLARGMGQNIASALIYKKSFKEAMRSAMESTLESIAGMALGHAIYSLALGFERIAERDYPSAGAAFEAAAIWATVGGAAAIAGRAMAPSQADSAAPSGAAGSNGSGTAASGSGGSGGASAGSSGPHVTVNVWGHVVGWANMGEFANAMNDAVLNSDVQLTATNTKTGGQVTR